MIGDLEHGARFNPEFRPATVQRCSDAHWTWNHSFTSPFDPAPGVRPFQPAAELAGSCVPALVDTGAANGWRRLSGNAGQSHLTDLGWQREEGRLRHAKGL